MTRYIPRNLKIDQVANLYAQVNPSDPFAFSRIKAHLKNQCCSFGTLSEVEEDSRRMLNLKDQNRKIEFSETEKVKPLFKKRKRKA